MLNKSISIVRDNDCIYLIQDLAGLNTYEKVRAIDRFVRLETLTLERQANRVIKALFRKNGINIAEESESVLKSQLDALNGKGKDIVITDLYSNGEYYRCEHVGTSKNHMNVYLEDDRYLQCGIEIKEVEIG